MTVVDPQREVVLARSRMAHSFSVAPLDRISQAMLVPSGRLSGWRQVGCDLQAVLDGSIPVRVSADQNGHHEGFEAAMVLARHGGA